MNIDVSPFLGKSVLIQFRTKYLVAFPLGSELDVSAPALSVDAWPFFVEQIDGRAVLTYLDESRTKKFSIGYLPAELVAFVTVLENGAPPEEEEAPEA